MKFPPSFIERLRSHFLLSEVIGRRIPIKKHGREYQALCPFHNEKTPSFTVNDEKGFFHCFGCSAHGDAIEFIKRFERLTYPETIEALAREAGIPLPTVTPEERKRAEAEKTLYDVMEAACQWFERQLVASSGSMALDYLAKRGLKPETIRLFRAGFAPDTERNALHQHLLKAGISQSLQAEAGVIIVPDSGVPYDRFRGRVIFPIRSASGRVVAFGGRLLCGDTSRNLPKYLNSPETPLFKKGELLYNFDLAKRPARDANLAVVMEGYMDVVSTAQAGVPYALATLGTAITPEHLRLLWQLAKEPVICLDGDAAGARAMMRAAEVALPLLKPGYSLRFAMLPAGEDPDSYIQKHGKASFEKILMSSRRLSQVLWETLSPGHDLALPESRAALEDTLARLADKIANPTLKQHYLSYFRKQLWTKAPAPAKAGQCSDQVRQLALQQDVNGFEAAAGALLMQLLSFPPLLRKSQVEETVSHLDIRSAYLNRLRGALLSAAHEQDALLDDRAAFVAYLQEQLQGELKTVPLKLPYPEDLSLNDALALWNTALASYQIAHLEYEMKELQQTVGQTMDEAALSRLIEIQQQLQQAETRRTFAPLQAENAAGDAG